MGEGGGGLGWEQVMVRILQKLNDSNFPNITVTFDRFSISWVFGLGISMPQWFSL